MPFIPHTEQEIAAMLATIDVPHIETLFNEIPNSLRIRSDVLSSIPDGMTELALTRLAKERASQDGELLCFIGAGAYEHYIPAAVWEIANRGEYMTAYTPYQAEASQGSLQLIYEYQTMMASLMGMEVSNASLYDGATALTEAILMAVRCSQKKDRVSVLIPKAIHPFYRQTVQTIISEQGIVLIEVPFQEETGQIDISLLDQYRTDDCVAFVIPQPNFFGIFERVDELSDWALAHNLLTIGLVNPMAMALLKPPGMWGSKGVDIACGEGQSLGIPLSGGGPYYGILTCKKNLVRQMPGRIVGRTVDLEGKEGFVLTLQAREQHIRRGKATSNICTNQGLMVTASTIYMSLMGPQGLRQIAKLNHQQSRLLLEELTAIKGVSVPFSAPFFNEVVIRIPTSASQLLEDLAKFNIQGGFALNQVYPELGECILICATETKTQADIKKIAHYIRKLLPGEHVACL